MVARLAGRGAGRRIAVAGLRLRVSAFDWSRGAVLIDQIEKYATEIPFVAIIRKIDRYYTLS